jgi:hypothetical protein
MRSCCLLLPLLILSVAPVLALPAAQLVNAGFDADADRDGLPDGWSRYVASFGHAETALDTQVKSAGTGSLRVEIADQTRCAISQYLSVSSGSAYTFSCRVRMTDPATTVAQVQIEWFAVVNWPQQIRLVKSDTPSAAIGDAADWTEVAAASTRPADADLALVAVIIGNGKTPAGKVWVDEARGRPGAFPAPLVTNAGFELDTDADGNPDGWGPAMYGGGFELKRDATVAHAGKASARLTGSAQHGDRSAYVQATPLFAPPGKLRLSFWYKGSGASYLIMHLLTPAGVQKPGGGIEYAVMSEAPPLSPDWQQFSQEIAVPPEAKQAGIMRVDIILYQKGEGTLWYDEVKLELSE